MWLLHLSMLAFLVPTVTSLTTVLRIWCENLTVSVAAGRSTDTCTSKQVSAFASSSRMKTRHEWPCRRMGRSMRCTLPVAPFLSLMRSRLSQNVVAGRRCDVVASPLGPDAFFFFCCLPPPFCGPAGAAALPDCAVRSRMESVISFSTSLAGFLTGMSTLTASYSRPWRTIVSLLRYVLTSLLRLKTIVMPADPPVVLSPMKKICASAGARAVCATVMGKSALSLGPRRSVSAQRNSGVPSMRTV
mmetsp:Transcript_37141/g.94867  ORF Transcript_37141/g.94867 Transcript_37141/m.94867 type:complete len:245 (-) Transcript_37141:2002-2736(-)